jgi:hypothetical protein
LVVAVVRSTEAILRWSWWRRWHQAWARLYHYRRRADDAPAERREVSPSLPPEGAESDRLESVWRRLEPLQARAHQGGRPCTHDRRHVLEAIIYVLQTDCGWRALPSNFPPWQTVYAQLRRWQKRGIWDEIWSESDAPLATQ